MQLGLPRCVNIDFLYLLGTIPCLVCWHWAISTAGEERCHAAVLLMSSSMCEYQAGNGIASGTRVLT